MRNRPIDSAIMSRCAAAIFIMSECVRKICGRLFTIAVNEVFQLREVQGLVVYASDEVAPSENRLEGLLVPVPDDIHTSVVNRTPEIFRARSAGPILSPGYDITRCDVPHSTQHRICNSNFRYFVSLVRFTVPYSIACPVSLLLRRYHRYSQTSTLTDSTSVWSHCSPYYLRAQRHSISYERSSARIGTTDSDDNETIAREEK